MLMIYLKLYFKSFSEWGRASSQRRSGHVFCKKTGQVSGTKIGSRNLLSEART